MINVTKTYLSPFKEYISFLRGIWQRNKITNNDTTALQIAVKARRKRKKEYYKGFKYLFTK